LAATGGPAKGVAVGLTVAGLGFTEVGAARGATDPAAGPTLLSNSVVTQARRESLGAIHTWREEPES